MDETFGSLIYSYSRKDALNDGVLIDVTETAKEAGFKIPVAVTNGLYRNYIIPDSQLEKIGQSKEGRLWDLLFMLYVQIKNCPKASEIIFYVAFAIDANNTKTIGLKAVIGPGDNAEPVLTIMLPDED